jgi:hypothetical protein
LLEQVDSHINQSYQAGQDVNALLNGALDILRQIDVAKLQKAEVGKYRMYIAAIKARNPDYSLANAMFIDSVEQSGGKPLKNADGSGEPPAKRIKISPANTCKR